MNKRKEKKGLAPSPQITPSVSAQGGGIVSNFVVCL